MMNMSHSYTTILADVRGRVGVITLNRPAVLNALNQALMQEVVAALQAFDADATVGCIVITGAGRAFAAGADIAEMQPREFLDVYQSDWFGGWEAVGRIRKPIIAAVNGFALGGGCEVAMMCDVILAADTAKFGQPEIKLGVLPGMGGTQRLTRLIGKAKAMEMCLTGRMMDAAEAERAGLVSRILPADKLLEEALAMGELIAGMSRTAAAMVKECIHRADELNLAEGLRFERRTIHAAFATPDQKEGMQAFLEKRPPNFPSNG
jgi:enoyl-CoA hydratase